MRHVPLVNAVQCSASEQGTSVLDLGYDMTKPRSFLGHRGSQDVLVEVLHSVALQRRRHCDPNACAAPLTTTCYLGSVPTKVTGSVSCQPLLCHGWYPQY